MSRFRSIKIGKFQKTRFLTSQTGFVRLDYKTLSFLYSSDSILSVFLILQINYLKFMKAVNYYISYIYDINYRLEYKANNRKYKTL
jgi:hypothetical protein